MTTMTPEPGFVTGGVDTHLDVHVAAALDQLGGVLGTAALPDHGGRLPAAAALAARRSGRSHAVGVEGTGSYGSALARHLADAGVRGDRGVPAEPAGPPPARQDRRRRRDRRGPRGAVR